MIRLDMKGHSPLNVMYMNDYVYGHVHGQCGGVIILICIINFNDV